jgi:hypothetical protein
MFAAMQDASFAAWDAVVASEFNDDLPTYPPNYIHEQAWKAALDAAPEVPDHREVMRLALEALEVGRRYVYADDRPQLENAIDALREALASDAMDRLAQADRELGLGERSDG